MAVYGSHYIDSPSSITILLYNDHGDNVKKQGGHWRAGTHAKSRRRRWLTKLYGHGTTSNTASRATIATPIDS